MRVCYLDASALVKLATPEPETDVLRGELETFDRHVTSRLATVEIARALVRRGVATAAIADGVASLFDGLMIVEVDAAIADAAGRIGPPALRSLDAVHLASAVALGPELDVFVTYDTRLAEAARAAGLEVVAPA